MSKYLRVTPLTENRYPLAEVAVLRLSPKMIDSNDTQRKLLVAEVVEEFKRVKRNVSQLKGYDS